MSDPFEITAFRFEQIAPFVDSSIDPAKRRDLMRRRAAVDLPSGKKRRIPRSTLHRWIKLYTQHGIRGLMPRLRADYGKSKTDKVTHTCSGCGDGSVFGCSSLKGGKATDGMEKH